METAAGSLDWQDRAVSLTPALPLPPILPGLRDEPSACPSSGRRQLRQLLSGLRLQHLGVQNLASRRLGDPLAPSTESFPSRCLQRGLEVIKLFSLSLVVHAACGTRVPNFTNSQSLPLLLTSSSSVSLVTFSLYRDALYSVHFWMSNLSRGAVAKFTMGDATHSVVGYVKGFVVFVFLTFLLSY